MPYSFELPGHVAQRSWAVYVIVTIMPDTSKKFYVGKVGDNHAGCNPIISRIGNHLSLNKIHGQLRNKQDIIKDARYSIHYETFGDYDEQATDRRDRLDKINEIERELNKAVYDRAGDNLLNRFHGKGYVPKAIREKRRTLLSPLEIQQIEALANLACS